MSHDDLDPFYVFILFSCSTPFNSLFKCIFFFLESSCWIAKESILCPWPSVYVGYNGCKWLLDLLWRLYGSPSIKGNFHYQTIPIFNKYLLLKVSHFTKNICILYCLILLEDDLFPDKLCFGSLWFALCAAPVSILYLRDWCCHTYMHLMSFDCVSMLFTIPDSRLIQAFLLNPLHHRQLWGRVTVRRFKSSFERLSQHLDPNIQSETVVHTNPWIITWFYRFVGFVKAELWLSKWARGGFSVVSPSRQWGVFRCRVYCPQGGCLMMAGLATCTPGLSPCWEHVCRTNVCVPLMA